MELLVGSQRAPVSVIESGTVVSRSTGRALVRLEVELTVRGDDANDEVEEALKSKEVVVGGIGNDADAEGRFRVMARSSSYRDERPGDFTHVIELEEVEDLFAEIVRIGDLEVRPYAYKEDAEEDLTIYLRTVISPEQQDALFALEPSDYLDVVRVGVNDRPEPMRLGRCLWQRDGEQIRQEIVLVHRSYDEAGHSTGWGEVGQPFQARAEEQLALHSERIERLVAVLGEAGVLTADQVTSVLDVPKEALERRSREFLRVGDLDAFLED
jgi:hypothetical protein